MLNPLLNLSIIILISLRLRGRVASNHDDQLIHGRTRMLGHVLLCILLILGLILFAHQNSNRAIKRVILIRSHQQLLNTRKHVYDGFVRFPVICQDVRTDLSGATEIAMIYRSHKTDLGCSEWVRLRELHWHEIHTFMITRVFGSIQQHLPKLDVILWRKDLEMQGVFFAHNLLQFFI